MATGKSTPKPQRKKGQSANYRRLSLLSLRRSGKRPSKGRVKHLNLPLVFSWELAIALRKYRTQKSRRSKRHKQWVFPIYLSSIKELAIIPKRHKRTVKVGGGGRFINFSGAWLRRRSLVPLLITVVGLGGVIYFGLQFIRPSPLELRVNNPVPVPTLVQAAEKTPQTFPKSEPTRVRVASINLDTELIKLGRNPDNTMEVPVRYDIAGWYTHAPTPGELGPAIIVGHVDRPGGIAIFWRLREIQPGDLIEVDRVDGKTVKFRADSIKQFPQDNFPTKEVYGNIDHSGIRLITCGGTFNSQTGRYTHNTVVYGSLVN